MLYPGKSRHGSIIAAAVLILAVPPGFATILDFEGPAPGTVIAGNMPGGGAAPGTYFPGLTVEVANGGSGPGSAIIFDSSSPTGWDHDLGTPNQACGGPGQGDGGQAGTPGENCEALGNILIVAENIVDVSPADGLVDDPDDEASGGTISFIFDSAIIPESIVILDIDAENASVSLYYENSNIVTINALDLGNNSAQTIDLYQYGSVDRIEVYFSSSGAVAELVFEMHKTSTEASSWGGVKKLFR